MLLDKFQYLPGNAWVGTDVTMVHFPVAQLFHLCILGWHDANSDLRCLAQVRTIERNRRNWPTPQPLPGLLAQALNLTESESRGPSPIRISYGARFRHRQRGLIWISERQRAVNRDLLRMSRDL